MGPQRRKAVILLSGGLDSAVTGAVAAAGNFDIYALTVEYGQRHHIETKSARQVGRMLQVAKHIVQKLDLRAFGGSALTDSLAVPKSANVAEIAQGIPITYVPARNTIFLSLALAFAETLGATDIFLGVNAIDYSGYPDCRPEFISAFERLARLGTKAGADGKELRIHAPLINMTKADIVREGRRLGVDFSLTHSCYDPTEEGLACGFCDSCLLRKQGFEQAGLTDPIKYAHP